jgi:4-amino-4-deoxy-L-arabinose transferase-like glycosyltransferase
MLWRLKNKRNNKIEKDEKMTRKVLLQLLPLFILYLAVFFALAKGSLDYGDEARYATYAENLTKGFYAPSDTRALSNGPGYPLLLTPFAFVGIPWYWAKMLNPVFIFLAVCFIYCALRNYMSEKTALFFTYLFGLYPPFYAELWFLLTEPLTLMLVSLFALLVIKWFDGDKLRHMLLAAVVCALIALTKVFFGYVASAALLLSLARSKSSSTSRKTVPIYALALLLCVPYLAYTYSITGKFFCWANWGGYTLYWNYTSGPDDIGGWKSPEDVATRPELAHHRPFFEKIQGLDCVQRDELMKKKAIENILNNPRKAALNYVCNLGRLFLNFPFSYKYQHPRTLLYLVPNALVVGAILLSLYPLIKLRRHLPPAIVHACGISAVYVAGHSFLLAGARYLCAIMPFIFIILTYTFTNLIRIQARIEQPKTC